MRRGLCGVVWCGVVWCGVVWCVWCGVVRRGAVWRGVAWCGVAWCGVGWRARVPTVGTYKVPTTRAHAYGAMVPGHDHLT